MNSPIEEPLPPPEEKGNGDARSARRLGEMQKGITMAQIAKAAGVSQGAISSLLNDRDYGIRVSERTRERVFKVCREMGYIPNDLRAVVRMYPELGEFCLLISEKISGGLSDSFAGRVAHAAMRAISDPSHPLTISIFDEERDYSGNLEDLPYPVRSGVASKFLFFGGSNVSLLQQILRRGLPAISLGTDIATTGVLSLVPDFVLAARMAIQHLIGLGHRHIGIVSGPFGSTDAQTIELHRGVKQAFDEVGTPIEAGNIVYGDLTHTAGIAALDELLGHPVKPTAVFCLSDSAAAGLLSRAQARGLRVPEDLSVIGCSDDCCAQFILPNLTTIHLPAEEMAEIGVKEVDRLVREGIQGEAQKRVLPVRLVERGSTGKLAGAA